MLEIPAQLDGYTATGISNEMCYDRSGVCSVTIPDSVISIGDFAFSFCNSLKTVTIPANVSSISERAFSWCSDTLSLTVGCGPYAAEYANAHDIACHQSGAG